MDPPGCHHRAEPGPDPCWCLGHTAGGAFGPLNKPAQVRLPQHNPAQRAWPWPLLPGSSYCGVPGGRGSPCPRSQASRVGFLFSDPFEKGVGFSGVGVEVGAAQSQTRPHLGPERVPAEGLCRAVFKVPRGQRNNHFSKKRPPGEGAQVPYRHLQPPGPQLGRLHLVLQRRREMVGLAPRPAAPSPRRPGPQIAGNF